MESRGEKKEKTGCTFLLEGREGGILVGEKSVSSEVLRRKEEKQTVFFSGKKRGGERKKYLCLPPVGGKGLWVLP